MKTNTLNNKQYYKNRTTGKPKSFIVLLILLAVLRLPALGKGEEKDPNPDRIIGSKVIKAYFTGFVLGDYIHVVFKNEKGKNISFFLQTIQAGYFAMINNGKLLELTVQKVETYIPEAGGYEKVERLLLVKCGTQTSDQWWKQQLQYSTEEKLMDKYDKMMDDYTITD